MKPQIINRQSPALESLCRGSIVIRLLFFCFLISVFYLLPALHSPEGVGGSAAFASTTTFINTTNSYYGRSAVVSKLVITITPEANDVNSVSSAATSTDSYFCFLDRVTLSTIGDDNDFTVTVKDERNIKLFEKTDCNTVTLPLSYALVLADADGNNYYGIPVADTLTVDTNDVDPNALTSIILTLYYRDWRY